MRINHLAVLVCAIVFFLLGYVWYSLLFHGMYTALMGVPEGATAMPGVSVLVGTFIVGWALAYFCAFAMSQAPSGPSAQGGVQFGLTLGIGAIATTMLITALNSGQSLALWGVNAGFYVVGLILIGGILGAWSPRSTA